MFSGIGGFDLALQRQGHEAIGYSEIDKYAIQVYEKHFKNLDNKKDLIDIFLNYQHMNLQWLQDELHKTYVVRQYEKEILYAELVNTFPNVVAELISNY